MYFVNRGRQLTSKPIGILIRRSGATVASRLSDAVEGVVIGDDVWGNRRSILLKLLADEEAAPHAGTQFSLYKLSTFRQGWLKPASSPPDPDDFFTVKEGSERSRSVPSSPEKLPSPKRSRSAPYRNRNGFDYFALSLREQQGIAELIKQFCDVYEVMGDVFRQRIYRIAYEQLMSRREGKMAFTPAVMEKIEEWRSTGTCKKLESLMASPHVAAKKTLMALHGVGPSQADRFVSQNILSIADLRKAVARGTVSLSAPQAVGLKYYEDFQKRIPRVEVASIIEHVADEVKAEGLQGVEVTPAGSFARGAPDSGDVDILLFVDDEATTLTPTAALARLISRLESSGFVTDTLTSTTGHPDNHTFLGVCRVDKKKPFRRIDIIVYAKRVKAFALVQWVAGEAFNRAIKLRATSLGYKLSDHGLYPSIKRGANNRYITGGSLHFDTVPEIFEFLKVPYNPEKPWDISVLGYGLRAWYREQKVQRAP